MTLQQDAECPSCEETRTFYRTAATSLHLGRKTKWRCPECGFGYVEVGGISTLSA
jgi:rubredoxin